MRLQVSELAGGKQFKVVANRDLDANEFIFDAPGLLSMDASDGHEHSSLSQLRPHDDQISDSSEGASRLFIGPIRFVNHRCNDWNTCVSPKSPLHHTFTDRIDSVCCHI